MPLPAILQFFQIDRCGFYRWGEARPAFGDVGRMLDDLHRWAIGSALPIKKTATFERGAKGLLPVYCVALERHAGSGCAVLATWNETEVVEGEYGSLYGAAPVGAPEVEMHEVPDGGIPGYPSYFWFDPREEMIVSVRFSKSSLNGHQGLDHYLAGFLESHSGHVVLSKAVGPDGTADVKGYRDPPAGEVHEDLTARFQSRAMRRDASIEFLRTNHRRIYKLRRKKTLLWNDPEHRSLFQKLLALTNLPGAEMLDTGDVELRFSGEIDFTPTFDEFDALVAQEQAEADESWSDIGLRLRGDPKTYWLSDAAIRHELSLGIQREENGLISARSLLLALTEQMPNIRRMASDRKR